MTVRIRGIRTGLQAGSVPARLATQGGPGPATDTTIAQLAAALVATGNFGLPGGPAASGGGYITSVDSSFTVTGGAQLQLHTITDGDLLANISGGAAHPIPNTLTAYLDYVLGSTEGNILQRGASAWQVLAPGTVGQVLTSGGAAALNSWGAGGSGTTISDGGVWSNVSAYSVGQVVRYNGATYLNYVAITASGAPAQQLVNGAGMTISTTNTTNDTATSTATANSYAEGNVSKTAGKWYFEWVWSNLFDNSTGVGICTAAGPIAGDYFYGNALGQEHGSLGGSGTGSFTGCTNNKRGAIAYDGTGQLFWICSDVTATPILWNSATVGTNLPATGTGGIATGAFGSAVFPFCYTPTSASQKFVIYTRTADFLIPAIPTGFSAWLASSSPNITPDLDFTHWVAQGNQPRANRVLEHALLGGL